MVLTSLCLLMGIRPVVKDAMIEEPGAGTRIGASVVHRAGATKNDRASPETTPPRRVGFIGLGVMGYPMAGHLARAGHAVAVYNRTAGKARAWIGEYGGRVAASPAEAARDAELVFVCVGNDDDLRSVVLGKDGALAGMTTGATLVDHTTASASLARELYAIAARARAALRGCAGVGRPVGRGERDADRDVRWRRGRDRRRAPGDRAPTPAP